MKCFHAWGSVICGLNNNYGDEGSKVAYGPVHHGYINITSKGRSMDVEVMVKI